MKRFKNILFFAAGSTEPGPALERGVNRLLAHYDLRTDSPEVHLLKGSPPATVSQMA
jgi:hypothetical protein